MNGGGSARVTRRCIGGRGGRGDRAGGCRHDHESDRRGSRAQCPEQPEVRRRPGRRHQGHQRRVQGHLPPGRHHAARRGQGEAPCDHLCRAGFDQRADPGGGCGRRGRGDRVASRGLRRELGTGHVPGPRAPGDRGRRRRHRARGDRLPGGESTAAGSEGERHRDHRTRIVRLRRSTWRRREEGTVQCGAQLRSARRRPPGARGVVRRRPGELHRVQVEEPRAHHHDQRFRIHHARLHRSGFRADDRQVRRVQDREQARDRRRRLRRRR